MDRALIHRIAASYAPARARPAVTTLLALEAQFAKFVFTASEPMLAQLRLAWWRDRFAQPPQEWPVGNPLLAHLRDWGPHAAALGRIVDGWEALLSDPVPSSDAFEDYCTGRAAGWQALAAHLEIRAEPDLVARACRRWSLADAAAGMADERAALRARERGAAIDGSPSLPRGLRSLAVLDTIGHRSLSDGVTPLSRPGDLIAVLRRGIIGR